jgi:hypothetical protein
VLGDEEKSFALDTTSALKSASGTATWPAVRQHEVAGTEGARLEQPGHVYSVFSQIDYHVWRGIGTWIRRKHGRISWREIRRRCCDQGWRFAHNGVPFPRRIQLAVTRYLGTRIPTPWTITQPATG